MDKVDKVVCKYTDEALTVSSEEIPPAEVKAKLSALRACASCGTEFVPEDDTHVTCPVCEAFGIRCGCVLGESCSICDAVAAIVYGGVEKIIDDI